MNYAFIHIPKNAGMYMENNLGLAPVLTTLTEGCDIRPRGIQQHAEGGRKTAERRLSHPPQWRQRHRGAHAHGVAHYGKLGQDEPLQGICRVHAELEAQP